MAFSLPQFPDGSFNPESACQCVSLLTAGWFNRDFALQRMLNLVGGGSVLAYHFQPAYWVPTWALLHCVQGDQHVLLIEGTDKAGQFTGHIAGGAFPASSTLFSPALVNPIWEKVFQGIYDEVLSLTHGGADIHNLLVTGHSYGGALAQLMAYQFAQTRGPNVVSLVTFGAPKGVSTGYAGGRPAQEWRVVNLGDAVPYTPPQKSSLNLYTQALVLVTSGKTFDWRHYGDQCVILGGSYSTYLGNSPASPLFNENIINPDFGLHLIEGYRDNLSAIWYRLYRQEPTSSMLAMIGDSSDPYAASRSNTWLESAVWLDTAAVNRVWFDTADGALTNETALSAQGVCVAVTDAQLVLPGLPLPQPAQEEGQRVPEPQESAMLLTASAETQLRFEQGLATALDAEAKERAALVIADKAALLNAKPRKGQTLAEIRQEELKAMNSAKVAIARPMDVQSNAQQSATPLPASQGFRVDP